MDGERICLITGGTSGIGRVAAREVARRGLRVVLVARDEARAGTTAAAIQQQTGATVDYLLADLSSQAEIRRLAGEFRARYGRLDVLVNNAGALIPRRELTADGIERTFALNHLAPFLLTNLLLDLLRASASARIVTVASAAHIGARIPFDDLNWERRPYRALAAYGQSKLANILFTYELARRLEPDRVTANALHPGLVASNFGKAAGGVWAFGYALIRPFSISPERGAETVIYLATAPDVEGVSGKYFVKCAPHSSSPASYDPEAQRRLWEVSGRLTGLVPSA